MNAKNSILPDKPVKRFLKLPYAGKKSKDCAHRIKILVAGHFLQVDFNFVYNAPRKIGELFLFKDKTKNKLERSLVVYSMSTSARLRGC